MGVYSEFTEELRQLGEIYAKTKPLILWSEQIDPNSRSNIQVYKELRDAFDHWMRVVARVNGPRDNAQEDLKYCKMNLDKCKGHVYRAMFDALDGAALSLQDRIKKNLGTYTSEIITPVMPDYWVMRHEIGKLQEQLSDLRNKKDIGEDFNFGPLADEYLFRLDSLKTWDQKLLDLGPLFAERKREVELAAATVRKEQRFIGIRIPLWLALASTVLSAALAYWLPKIFD